MLEQQHVIQTRGFRNLKDESGNITGFQFRIRKEYYKGLWLSQVRVGDVKIDGKVYSRDEQIWVVNGVEYTPDEMLEIGDSYEDTYWQVYDTATIKIKKEGGLPQGYHDVYVKYGWVCNYAPSEAVDPEFGSSFAGFEHEKKLLMV